MQKLPIGMSEFTEIRGKNRLYVDKTRHVYSLLNENQRTFLSRPRRFGKSLFLNTLEAALQGKKELFEGLWISNSDYSWEPYGVIKLDFSELSVDSKADFMQDLKDMLVDIGDSYGISLQNTRTLNSTFRHLILQLSDQIPLRRVAILIDEYDSPILHALHDPKLAISIREVLKSFSSVIKAQSKKVQFVFVTGVSAFSKSGLSFGLNNLKNLTMLSAFSDICGYTEEELDRYFYQHFEAWAKNASMSCKDLRDKVKAWYNGYLFKENTPTIYSPFSLTCAVDIQEIRNFWFESATPQFLLEELKQAERKEEVRFLHLDHFRSSMDLLQTFEIENIPLPALLFQMGYLTLDEKNPLTEIYSLRYPNLEVKTALHRHLLIALTHIGAAPFDELIASLFASLQEKDLSSLVQCFQKVFARIPYQLYEQASEKLYHAVVQALFVVCGVPAVAEYSTSLGRADIIVELPEMIYVFELKTKIPSEKALE